jgi:hypothetical protein
MYVNANIGTIRNTTEVSEIKILEMTKIDVEEPRQIGLSIHRSANLRELGGNRDYFGDMR